MTNNVEQNNQVEVKIKERKVYLADNKNDIYQKKSVDYLKREITKSALYTYNGKKPSDKDFKKFMTYLERQVKPNKSKNDINYRIESLYNFIISKYSDYIELTEIITDDNEEETNLNQN